MLESNLAYKYLIDRLNEVRLQASEKWLKEEDENARQLALGIDTLKQEIAHIKTQAKIEKIQPS